MNSRKNSVAAALEFIGFALVSTGGGCMAYSRGNEDGGYTVITNTEGIQVPETMDEPVWVGDFDCDWVELNDTLIEYASLEDYLAGKSGNKVYPIKDKEKNAENI